MSSFILCWLNITLQLAAIFYSDSHSSTGGCCGRSQWVESCVSAGSRDVYTNLDAKTVNFELFQISVTKLFFIKEGVIILKLFCERCEMKFVFGACSVKCISSSQQLENQLVSCTVALHFFFGRNETFNTSTQLILISGGQ